MADEKNPAILAIERAKYAMNEELESSRGQMNHLQQEVNKATKNLEAAVTGRDRQAQQHAWLQQQMNQLQDAQRVLEKAEQERTEAL